MKVGGLFMMKVGLRITQIGYVGSALITSHVIRQDLSVCLSVCLFVFLPHHCNVMRCDVDVGGFGNTLTLIFLITPHSTSFMFLFQLSII